MSDAPKPQSQQPPRQPTRDPVSLLAQLIPSDRAERRRAVAALLRAVVGDDQQGGV